MKICMLDAETIGKDLDLSMFETLGTFVSFPQTLPEEVAERISDAEVVLVNKVRLNRQNLAAAQKLRLICVAATGYDNVDVVTCRERKIAVCNVAGYSTSSVVQLTFSMALQLICHLPEYTDYVKSGEYSAGLAANRLEPVYHELAGCTWGGDWLRKYWQAGRCDCAFLWVPGNRSSTAEYRKMCIIGDHLPRIGCDFCACATDKSDQRDA